MTKQEIISDANSLINMWKAAEGNYFLQSGVTDIANKFVDMICERCESADIKYDKNDENCYRSLCYICADSNDCGKQWAIVRDLRSFGKITFLNEDYLTDDDFALIDYTDDNCDEYYFVNPDKK